MKRSGAPLTLREVLRRRGILSCVCADILRRVDVAVRFGLGADARSRQRAAGVYHVGHRVARRYKSAA